MRFSQIFTLDSLRIALYNETLQTLEILAFCIPKPFSYQTFILFLKGRGGEVLYFVGGNHWQPATEGPNLSWEKVQESLAIGGLVGLVSPFRSSTSLMEWRFHAVLGHSETGVFLTF